MDKAARALQLAGCVAHTGDAFSFDPGDDVEPVTWTANPSAASAPGSAPLNPLTPPQALKLVGPRAVFAGTREPGEGDVLTDAAGNSYRVHARGEDLTGPLLTLFVTTSAL